MSEPAEMRARLGGFVLVALAALVPLSLLWWFSVDVLTAGLRPFAAALAGLLLPVTAVTTDAHAGWLVETGLMVAAGKTNAGPEVATFTVAANYLHRLGFAWPLFVALMLAPPRPPHLLGRVLGGLVILAVLWTALSCVFAFYDLVMLVNHLPAGGDVPPPYFVAWPAYGETAVFLAGCGNYAALQVLPLLAPPLLWLALNPAARSLVLDNGRVRRGSAGKE